jgi:serine/threonine protein kinase/CheY-like chemotaxis protein
VDDEESIRMLLTDVLESNGYEVITAQNGVEGVRKTFAEVPDVVLTDIMMPNLNGISFLVKVRAKIPPTTLPIIVISALGLETQVVQAFQAGATDYLTKPFRPGELIARIQVALEQRVDPRNVVFKEPTGEGRIHEKIGAGSVLDMGKYRILRELGSGGMGTVYQAKHMGYGVEVALKVLKPELAAERKNILRFLREVRIAAQMNHPNIVQVFDVGLSGDCYYYAMENLPLRSLFQRVRDEGPLEEPGVLKLGLQLASALKYMHDLGYMHRDVKPDNVLLVSDDRAKLIDFGLACSADDQRLTQEGTFIGTPGYVAPENVQEYRAPDPATDIYSLGATLYFASAGKSPFHDKKGATQRLTAQIREFPRPLHEADPRISQELSDVIMKMLEPDPADRYAFIEEVCDELEEREA